MKRDYVHQFFKWISNHRYSILALAMCGLLVSGCTILQPKAPSPLSGKPVNRWQLQAEKAEFDAKFRAAEQMIAAQDQVWSGIINAATQAAMSVPGPVGGLLAAIPTITMIGLGLDVAKKNRKINELKGTKS